MIRLFCVFLAAGLAAGIGIRLFRADDEPKPAPEPPPAAPAMRATSGLLIDLGNENCPVMGGGVDGTTWFEWKSLRVGFCCPGCDKAFLRDPAQALDKTGVKWREALAAAKRYEAAAPAHKEHVLADIKRDWKVVRD